MGEVVTSVRRVTDIISEISLATQEQSAGIDQINMALSQMDHVTQQNAALVEEAAAASAALEEQAARLMEVVSVFKLDPAARAALGADAPARRPAARALAVVPPAASTARKGVARSTAPAAAAKTAARAPVSAAAKPASDDWEEF
jgi:methyl-accepting chemotaxis protein